jgi:hypothetical protein
MSSPRDLRLERLGDRDGQRLPHLDKTATVGSAQPDGGSTSESRLSYEALIDAVFTAPGAFEWLSGLRRMVAAMLADNDLAPRVPASANAIRTSPTTLRL